MAQTRKVGPMIPGVPEPIPADWWPEGGLLRTLRPPIDDDDLEATVNAFRTQCLQMGIRRARWGHTFRTWLQRGRPTDWKLRTETF